MTRPGRGHLIADRRVEVAAGLAAFALGGLLLHDAYERRAKQQPFWLKPFAFW